MKKPKIKKLPNGLRILLVPQPLQRTATALVLVEAGSKYETKEVNGISHFLEHMCFKGTTRRPSQAVIAGELDRLGADFNAFTGHEYTGYYVKTAAAYLPQTVDLLADIYANSLFNQSDIDQEKGAIVGEINMYEDVPMRKVSHLFMKLLYGDQPAGWEIAGPKELITTFTREDFLAYRKKHYVPEASIIVVAGKFNEERTLALIREKFGALARGKKEGKVRVRDRQGEPAVLIEKKESDQTHLVVGVRSVPLGHRDYPVLSVMAAILGSGMSSRLFQKVRTELGLGYYVHASNESLTDHGLFSAAAGVVNERAGEAVSAILAEFGRLKREQVGAEELNKVKDMLAGRLVLGLESSDEVGEFYGFQEVLRRKLRTPEEVIARMRRVSPKDIQRVARTIFATKHLNLAMVGPATDEQHFRALLTI